MNIELGTLPSLIVAISILFAGYLLVARIAVLGHYNIPGSGCRWHSVCYCIRPDLYADPLAPDIQH